MPSATKRKAPQQQARTKQLRLWAIIGAVVVGIAIVAIIASTGGSGTPSSSGSETRSVTVTGDALPAFPGPDADPAVGMAAPTLAGESFGGQPVTIDPGSTGNPTAIWFVAHWCPHCQTELPRIVSLSQQGALASGVDVYAVSTGVNASAPNYPPSAWLRSVGWPFPVMADSAEGATGKAYGLAGFPYLVLIDAEGNVVARHSGELGEDGIALALGQLTMG